MELNLSYSFGNYAAEIGYIEQRSEYGSPQLLIGEPGNAVDNPIFSDRFERTPNRYGVLKLSYDDSTYAGYIAGKLTGRMTAPHVNSDPLTGAQINNSLDISPNFFVVDVGISRTWVLGDHTDLTASLAIKNLFNDFQGDLDNGPYRDPAYVMGPRFPRTYFAGLTLGSDENRIRCFHLVHFAPDRSDYGCGGRKEAAQPAQRIREDVGWKNLEHRRARRSRMRATLWSLNCRPCLEVVPRLRRLNGSWKERNDVVLVSLPTDEDLIQVRRHVKRHRMSWTHLVTEKGSALSVLAGPLGVQRMPTPYFWIVDGNGEIREQQEIRKKPERWLKDWPAVWNPLSANPDRIEGGSQHNRGNWQVSDRISQPNNSGFFHRQRRLSRDTSKGGSFDKRERGPEKFSRFPLQLRLSLINNLSPSNCRRPSMNFMKTDWRRAVMVVMAALGLCRAEADDRLADARAAVSKWVDVERTISREALAWEDKKTLLNDLVAVARTEIRTLQQNIAEADKATGVAEARQAELVEKRDSNAELAKKIETFLVGIEGRLRGLTPRLPKALGGQTGTPDSAVSVEVGRHRNRHCGADADRDWLHR